MAEKAKKTTAKKSTKPTTTTAPKSRSTKSTKAQKSTRSAATTASTRSAASTTPKSTSTTAEVITHYTSEPSVWKLRLTQATKATIRTARSRRFWAWVGGVVVAIFLLLMLWWQWQRSYVAVVGGQYLPVSMMDAQLRANYGSNGVNSIIQQQLIMQEANRQHVTISQDKVTEELDKVISSSGGDKAYQTQLKQLGIPEPLLRQQIEVQLMRQELLKDKTKVSDQEISDYYDKNKASIDPNGEIGQDGLKDQIQQTLQQQKLDSATPEFIDSLKQRFHVETYLDHLSLSFSDFLNQTIAPIPDNLWKFISGQQ